jgi:hypothetical protein
MAAEAELTVAVMVGEFPDVSVYGFLDYSIRQVRALVFEVAPMIVITRRAEI